MGRMLLILLATLAIACSPQPSVAPTPAPESPTPAPPPAPEEVVPPPDGLRAIIDHEMPERVPAHWRQRIGDCAEEHVRTLIEQRDLENDVYFGTFARRLGAALALVQAYQQRASGEAANIPLARMLDEMIAPALPYCIDELVGDREQRTWGEN